MPNHTSLYAGTGVVSLLIPTVFNSDQNSAGMDLANADEAMIVIYLGLSADTLNSTNKIEIEIEESDDDSSYTDVADADLTNYVTGTNTGTVKVVNSASLDETV